MKLTKTAAIICIAALAAGCAQHKKNATAGADRDPYGCIPSAGYTWSRIEQRCLRLFEEAIRLYPIGTGTVDAFVILSPDSTRAELFFPDRKESVIMKQEIDRNGQCIWTSKDSDERLSLADNLWTVTKNNKIIFRQQLDGCEDTGEQPTSTTR